MSYYCCRTSIILRFAPIFHFFAWNRCLVSASYPKWSLNGEEREGEYRPVGHKKQLSLFLTPFNTVILRPGSTRPNTSTSPPQLTLPRNTGYTQAITLHPDWNDMWWSFPCLVPSSWLLCDGLLKCPVCTPLLAQCQLVLAQARLWRLKDKTVSITDGWMEVFCQSEILLVA